MKKFKSLAEYENFRQIYMDSVLTFFGLETCQNPESILAINRLLNSAKPSRIIELGSGRGGLSVLLAIYSKLKGSEFCTYDAMDFNKNQKIWDLLSDFGYPVINEDFISNIDVVKDIRDKISSTGTTLLICDAAKKTEFLIYANKLKIGDYVMIHDYSPNKDFYRDHIQHHYWSTNEINYSDIKSACDENDILEISPVDFWKAAWFVGVKVQKEKYVPFDKDGINKL